jgi:hypothetical protein
MDDAVSDDSDESYHDPEEELEDIDDDASWYRLNHITVATYRGVIVCTWPLLPS